MAMLRVFTLFVMLVSFGFPSAILADDTSSANYQILGSTFVPAVLDASSANFSLTTGLDPFVGLAQSANWNVRSGAPVKDTIEPTTPPSGGGGPTGGPPYVPPTFPPTPPGPGTSAPVPPPTLIFRSPTFASHQVVHGSYPSSTIGVIVNGSSQGVVLSPGYLWERDLPIFLGMNQVFVNARDANGNLSPTIGGEIERMLIGDVDRSHRVDDRDLSLFTRAWSRYTPYADFNEDGLINDIDLSLLASHWGLFY